jgi:hypothetical protein
MVAPKPPPQNAEIIYQFDKSKREIICATLKRFGGKEYAGIRTYYEIERDSAEQEYVPPKKGITVRLDLLPELERAIDALVEAAAANGGVP